VFKNRVLRKIFVFKEGGSNKRLERTAHGGVSRFARHTKCYHRAEMRHLSGRREMHKGFWWGNLKERATLKTSA
jgi:hypothetical protein